MKKLFSLVFMLFLAALVCQGQSDSICISADRPGATTGSDVMPKGKFQWETGMEFENDFRSGSSTKNWNINNSLFRLGVSNFAEFRAAGRINKTSFDGGSKCSVSDISLGTKVKVFEGYKAVPAISLMAELLIPNKDADDLPERIGSNIHLLFSNGICSWFSIGYDVGITWTGNPRENEQIFAGICFNFQPTDRLTLFIEEYNNFYEECDIKTEFGAAYLISNRLQIDVYADLDLKNPTKYYNLGFGLAWLIN